FSGGISCGFSPSGSGSDGGAGGGSTFPGSVADLVSSASLIFASSIFSGGGAEFSGAGAGEISSST
ncbi:hypothetical protein A2U01_0102664, partial [Trifolium medium]|nr:hypothetical protein [Trifolium medium]